jgi:hypothetical protein
LLFAVIRKRGTRWRGAPAFSTQKRMFGQAPMGDVA